MTLIGNLGNSFTIAPVEKTFLTVSTKTITWTPKYESSNYFRSIIDQSKLQVGVIGLSDDNSGQR